MDGMEGIELKRKWASGLPSPGFWVRLADPTVVEMLGEVGFDWIMFDVEHAALDLQTLQTLLIALNGTNTLPLVRVPSNDLMFIKRVLDIGAVGVLVPQVKTAEDVRQAVAACKYPPAGVRGAGPRRPGRYGRKEKEYIAGANEQTIAMVMIETVEAVSNIDSILAVEGLDAIVLGPVDLATGMGLFGDFEHPRVQEAIGGVIERARHARVPFGDGRPVEDLVAWLKLGAQIIALGDDELSIRRSAYAAMTRFEELAAGGG
jgi:4-hydroxy-2-oxoheptanedioate aldolase